MNFRPMNSLKNISIFFFTIIIVTISCKNFFRKDQSLTEKEYMAKGMPDIGKVWAEQELIKAHVTLGSLRTKNFLTLPLKDSRKSGKVFSRIISRANLSFLDDPSKALHDKAYEIQTLANFMNEISRMYHDNFKIEQYYSRELIEIYLFEIYIREKMLDLSDKIMNSKDIADMAMSSGREAIEIGYVNLITTLVLEQEKTNSYSSGDLRRLSGATLKSVKENLKYINTRSKQRLSGEISKASEKIKSGFARKDISEMLKLLSE
jgi:hypothetical protein